MTGSVWGQGSSCMSGMLRRCMDKRAHKAAI